MITVEKVLLRRDIHARFADKPVVLFQTALGTGDFRNNGIMVGDRYGRPDKDGVWPEWVPTAVLRWALGQV